MVEAKTKYLFILFLILSITGCGKEDHCSVDLIGGNEFVFYNEIFGCGGEDFSIRYNSRQEFLDEDSCVSMPIPFPVGFNGIVVGQGIQVDYSGPNGAGSGYSYSLNLDVDTCEKVVDFKFVVNTLDTSVRFSYNENVVILLDGIDSTYIVNFSRELIPYTE